MLAMSLMLAEAIKTCRLSEFVVQQEPAGLPVADRAAFDRVPRAAVKLAKSKVEHRLTELAMVRPVTKLGELSGHPLLADVNMRAAHRGFEQPPEAFNAVRVKRFTRPPVVPTPFFGSMLDRSVRVTADG